MNKLSKKTAFVLIGLLAISLVAGNVLFANDFESVTGIVASDDLDYISNGFTENTVSGNSYKEDLSGLVLAQDLAFVAEPFSRSLLPTSGSVYSENDGPNIVNGSDIAFVHNGALGSDTANLVCVVDGAQVSGKACVN